jgi:hypothetical protein
LICGRSYGSEQQNSNFGILDALAFPEEPIFIPHLSTPAPRSENTVFNFSENRDSAARNKRLERKDRSRKLKSKKNSTKRGSTYLFKIKRLNFLARIVLIQESKREAKMTRL